MDVPSMVRRSGGKLIVRQVVSGEQVVLDEATKPDEVQHEPEPPQLIEGDSRAHDNATLSDTSNTFTPHQRLPQCKVKRNYSCDRCSYYTQNPRSYLTHLRDTHGEKISVNECKRCLYASRHYQKLVRHMRMVHGVAEEPTKAAAPLDHRHRKHIKKEHLPNQLAHSADAEATIPEQPKSLDAWTSLYTQQLVASLLPVLLKNIDKSLLSSVFPTFDLSNTPSVKSEMDGTQSTASSPEQGTTRGTWGKEKNVRESVDESEPIPKKRARPIPNLIPLAAGGSTHTARSEKDLLKPVPMSVLMPPEPNVVPDAPPSTPVPPLSLSSQTPRVPTLVATHTKCTFCELSFNTTVELANHIAAAHKEDLITSLLQKSMDETNQNIFPQNDAIDSASNEIWKSLLEANTFTNMPDVAAREQDDGKRQPSTKDDDEVEILDNKSETYCGVETAPGYGEVTSKITSTDGNVAGLMKKVFKCPHCSFWASTASRFHVHIVGHLNKKPFECSLCSYRSNWRWDITKHIRLKTIRDPSHKNAGVLMNDETGRRNYTKYNKYITLMQITDNSTRESPSYAKSFAENNVSDLVSACGTYNIDLKAFATMHGLGFLLEDKQMNEPDVAAQQAGAKADEGGQRMKCQLCEFRTTSKEELLLHFTSSHTALGQQLEDVIDSEPINTPAQSNTPQPKTSTTRISSTPTPPATAICSLSKSAANTSNDSPTNGTLLTASGVGDKTLVESGDRAGDGDASVQRMAMPATWRHNAPYRCGHCHQVSNWKHVIQRHCRLKHNGHVFIEHVNSEKDDPSDGEGQLQRNGKPGHHSVYVIEDVLHPTTSSNIDHPRKSIEVSSTVPPPLAPFSMQDDVGCAVNTLEPIVEIIDKDPTDMINFSGGLMPSTVLVDSGTVAPAVPSEQLECISCQFRAETVDQLTEHLEQHMSNDAEGGSGNSFDSSGLLDPVPTTMYYCPRCPARFFHKHHVMEHGEKHVAIDGNSCRFCSYTTTDIEERNRHEDVHSAAYNINTDNLQIFLAESKEYPKPHLTLQETSDGVQLFYVEKTPAQRAGEAKPPETSPPRKSKKHSKQRARSPAGSSQNGEEQLRSIFLCEYCDQTFEVESELNEHVRTHFSSILSPQDVAYYTSLSSTLNKEKKLELVVSGAQSTMALHYVYDNARKKDWNVYSKTESVLLKF